MGIQNGKTLFADSERYRAKVESQQLCDLGCSIPEKYGPTRGWKLSLRNYVDDDPTKVTTTRSSSVAQIQPKSENLNLVEYRSDIGKTGISAIVKDNRSARIEIVRRTPISPAPKGTG